MSYSSNYDFNFFKSNPNLTISDISHFFPTAIKIKKPLQLV